MLHGTDWKLRGYPDPRGREYQVRLWEPRDLQALTLTYLSFSCDDGFAGIPPRDRLMLGRWLARLTRHGVNSVACIGGVVAAHAVLVPSVRASTSWRSACTRGTGGWGRATRPCPGCWTSRPSSGWGRCGRRWMDGTWRGPGSRGARDFGCQADGFWRIDLRPPPAVLHLPETVALPAAAAPA